MALQAVFQESCAWSWRNDGIRLGKRLPIKARTSSCLECNLTSLACVIHSLHLVAIARSRPTPGLSREEKNKLSLTFFVSVKEATHQANIAAPTGTQGRRRQRSRIRAASSLHDHCIRSTIVSELQHRTVGRIIYRYLTQFPLILIHVHVDTPGADSLGCYHQV